jgi:hypothetical protein
LATILTGMVDTEDELSNRKVVDMSERLYKLQPDDYPLLTMLNEIGSKPATREVIDWLEDELHPRVSSLAASGTSAATSLTVTTGEGTGIFRVNDVVRVMETGEAMLVTSTSANSIGVTRGLGAVTAASASSVAKLMVIHNIFGEGASSGEARAVKRVRGFNYTGITRHTMFFSGTQTAIELYDGSEPGMELVKKGKEHKRSLEQSLYFGPRYANTGASPGPQRSQGGAVEYISTYITDAGGNLTPSEMDLFLEGPFGFGSKNKVIFCAPRPATVFSQMFRDKWQPTVAGDNRVYGARVDAFIHATYGGSIPVIVKRDWADLDKTSTNYGTWAFLIDMEYIRHRPLKNNGVDRWMQLRRNIQPPDADAVIHEYLSEASFEFGWEKCHGILKGITGYAAS